MERLEVLLLLVSSSSGLAAMFVHWLRLSSRPARTANTLRSSLTSSSPLQLREQPSDLTVTITVVTTRDERTTGERADG